MNLNKIKKTNIEIDQRFLSLVDAYIKDYKDRGLSFYELWTWVLNDELFNRLLINGVNEFQHRKYEYLLFIFIKFFRQNKVEFLPDISSNKNLKPGELLVMTHSGFPLISHIASYSRHMAIMTDYPIEVQRLSGSLHSSKILTFPRDKFSLLTIRNLLSKNILTICTIDFRSSVPGVYDTISDSIFKLSHKCSIPVNFGSYQVSKSGNLEIVYSDPYLDNSDNLADEFLLFQKKIRPNVHYILGKFDHAIQREKISARVKI